jgi:hypothetical protein
MSDNHGPFSFPLAVSSSEDDDPAGDEATSACETNPGEAPGDDQPRGSLDHIDHVGEWEVVGHRVGASRDPNPAEARPPPAEDHGELGSVPTEISEGATGASTLTARWAANRRNARRSTGPRTEEGKQVSSRNAMKHGVYAGPHPVLRGVLAEDADEVQGFCDAVVDELGPRNAQEQTLARRIANTELNLARIDRYESVGLGAAGRISRLEEEAGLGDELSACLLATGDLLLARAHLELGTEASEETLGSPTDWVGVAVTLSCHHCVPPGGPSSPFVGDVDEEEAQARFRDYVLGVEVPRCGMDAVLANITRRLEELDLEASMRTAQAEEVAIQCAIRPGGILDRGSTMRARHQRSLERDRETYARLQRRPPARPPHDGEAEPSGSEPNHEDEGDR